VQKKHFKIFHFSKKLKIDRSSNKYVTTFQKLEKLWLPMHSKGHIYIKEP